MLSSLIIIGFSTASYATEADLQAFTLASEVEVIPPTDLDSGWWPESGPIRIRTVLEAEGTATMTMDGDSIVEASNGSMTHRLEASEDTAQVELSASIFASLHLNLDVAGYTYDDVLAEKGFDINKTQIIDTFAFASDGGETVDFIVDTQEIFEVDQGIFPLVDVVVTASVTPTAILEYATHSITADGLEFTAADQVESTGGALPTSIAASGQVDSFVELTIDGHAEVCVMFMDCYGDFDFDFPLDPMEHSQPIDFEAVALNHTLDAADSTGNDSNDGQGLPSGDTDDEAAAESSGGCSTASHPTGLLPLMALFGAMLIRIRRQGA